VFAKHYPHFDMHVKVKGASQEDSESCPDIERLYQRHEDAQVLFNPVNKFKAMRKLQKGPNTGSAPPRQAPGIFE